MISGTVPPLLVDWLAAVLTTLTRRDLFYGGCVCFPRRALIHRHRFTITATPCNTFLAGDLPIDLLVVAYLCAAGTPWCFRHVIAFRCVSSAVGFANTSFPVVFGFQLSKKILVIDLLEIWLTLSRRVDLPGLEIRQNSW